MIIVLLNYNLYQVQHMSHVHSPYSSRVNQRSHVYIFTESFKWYYNLQFGLFYTPPPWSILHESSPSPFPWDSVARPHLLRHHLLSEVPPWSSVKKRSLTPWTISSVFRAARLLMSTTSATHPPSHITHRSIHLTDESPHSPSPTVPVRPPSPPALLPSLILNLPWVMLFLLIARYNAHCVFAILHICATVYIYFDVLGYVYLNICFNTCTLPVYFIWCLPL